MASDLVPDRPLNFRQRSIFFYNLALEKYLEDEFEASRLDLNQIICHQYSVMEQALALEKLDWALGLDICCLSLELSVKLNDRNAIDVMNFYYLNHMKSLRLLSEKDVMKIEAILALYKLALKGDAGNITFGHLMELWKFEIGADNDARLLNNIGCLLGHTNSVNASKNHFDRALSNPSISSFERNIIQHNKIIIERN